METGFWQHPIIDFARCLKTLVYALVKKLGTIFVINLKPSSAPIQDHLRRQLSCYPIPASTASLKQSTEGLQPPWGAGVLIPNLPNELALVCLARVPRVYHRALLAVSKPIRSAVLSPDFFETRSRLGFSEDVTYVQLLSPLHSATFWFTLHRSQEDETLIRIPVPLLPVTHLYASATVAMAGKIYVCGGWTYDAERDTCSSSTSGVWVLDCRSGVWSPGPTMVERRSHARAVVVGGKIYVVGNFSRAPGAFAEVLEAGGWEALPEPPVLVSQFSDGVVAAADGCMLRVRVNFTELSFNTEEWRWTEPAEMPQKGYAIGLGDMAMVDGAIYKYESAPSNGLKQFHRETGEWELVLQEAEGAKINTTKGAKIKTNPFFQKLVSVGGKLVVMSGRTFSSTTLPQSISMRTEVDTDTGLRQFNYRTGEWDLVLRDAEGDKLKTTTPTSFEAWCTEVDISERRVLRSEKVFEIPHPAEDTPNMTNCTPILCAWDWNIFQVSL